MLGILYESYIHPLTILSTLPSGGCRAAGPHVVFVWNSASSRLIGIILLIGIVKKNAIMMIDFALDAEAQRGQTTGAGHLRSRAPALSADHDDDHGCALRRPAAGDGDGRGSEVRRPSASRSSADWS